MNLRTLQEEVNHWMLACFGPQISADKLERCDRFIEEALELVQASGYSKDRAYKLVDYVFDRPEGEINQEVGGVLITLAALANANNISLQAEALFELARVWKIIDKIRAKQASKPTGSALPTPTSPSSSQSPASSRGKGRASASSKESEKS
jgi:NTP pyrophosphatase (non-canonical NTP hydrolase)